MKKLILISLALLLAVGIFADVIIGTGTNHDYTPFNAWQGYGRSASIYTAAEINATGLITHLGWEVRTARTTAIPIKVYLKITQDTSLTPATWNNMKSGASQVYTLNYAFNATGWNSANITDFNYSPSMGNLLVLCESNFGGSGTSNCPNFYNTATATNTNQYWQNDGSAPTGTGGVDNNRPNIKFYGITSPELPPGICSLVFPTPDGATGVGASPSLQWTIGVGGTPTGYDVYLGTSLPLQGYPNISHNSQTNNIWAPGLLNYNTVYYLKIVPWNSYGHPDIELCPTWSFTTMIDPDRMPLPYTQNFDSGASFAAIHWTGNMLVTANHGVAGTKGLNKLLSSAITSVNAVSCLLGPMTANAELRFDYRIVNDFGYPNTGTTIGPGDTIKIQVSTDSGNSFSTIHTINNTNHVPSNAFVNLTLGLDAYSSGEIKIKFLITRGNGDYYVDIDNFVVSEIPPPPDPVSLISPANNSTNLSVAGFPFTWAPASTGGAASSYSLKMTRIIPSPAYHEYTLSSAITSFNPVTSGGITFNYNETWSWYVQTENTSGAIGGETFYFSIVPDYRISSLPYIQNFDEVATPGLPPQWTAYKSSAIPEITTSSQYFLSASNSVCLNNKTLTSGIVRLISPKVTVPMNSLNVSFYARGEGAYNLKFGTVSALDGSGVFTELASIDVKIAYKQFTIPLQAYAGTHQYLCFQHNLGGNNRKIYIDNLEIQELIPSDMMATLLKAENFCTVNNPHEFNITVRNNGSIAQSSYNVLLKSSTNSSLASLTVNDPLAAGASRTHLLTWTPGTNGHYDLVGAVELSGDGDITNNQTAVKVFGVYPGYFLRQIGSDADPNISTNTHPLDMRSKTSISETLYTASEMQFCQGKIKGVAMHYNFSNSVGIYDFLGKPVKIWVKCTYDSNVSTNWLDWDGYVLVYDGVVDFLNTNRGIVYFPFSSTIRYTDSNFAVRVCRELDTEYPTSCRFYYENRSGAHRSRYIASNSVLDPLNPPLTGSSSSGYVPVMSFMAIPSTYLDAPVVTITKLGANIKLNWAPDPDVTSYQIFASDDPLVWPSTPVTTVTSNSYTTTSSTKKFFRVVAVKTDRD